MIPARQSVDVEAVRARYPLADVVTASGVELHRRGHGWVGSCPFHDDATPSLSVDGVPDRFHCFGCGASGDVIDFVQRTRGLGFLEAVAELEGQPQPARQGENAGKPNLRRVRDNLGPAVPVGRALEINALAWAHFSAPVPHSSAVNFLKHHRGIDLHALMQQHPSHQFVGYAGNGWTTLTDHLRAGGVTDDELLVMDLSARTRGGRLIDTMRNRVIVPVSDSHGRIQGFIGRDVTGHPAAPKYRNPTRTPVFDKAQAIYRPTQGALGSRGQAVVVEGVLDALALAAAAAAEGIGDRIAPCSANGVSVSPAQARLVLQLSPHPVRVALDGDDAGKRGSERWLTAVSLDAHRAAFVISMPPGADPAGWIAQQGPTGVWDLLSPVTRIPPGSRGLPLDRPAAHLPGRELAELARNRATDPVRDTAVAIARLARCLDATGRADLAEQATAEMTRHGWNPKGIFAIALQRELEAASTPPTRRSAPALTPSIS